MLTSGSWICALRVRAATVPFSNIPATIKHVQFSSSSGIPKSDGDGALYPAHSSFGIEKSSFANIIWPSSNLWAGITTNNYDGYLNVYDPVNNTLGANYNTSSFRNPSTSSSWTTAQINLNKTFPKLTLKNVQMGAIINFQLCLREYSLGIHNTAYTKALLQNSIDALTAAGF